MVLTMALVSPESISKHHAKLPLNVRFVPSARCIGRRGHSTQGSTNPGLSRSLLISREPRLLG